MIRAQFRIRIPDEEWVADVSQAFPDATFRLLSGLRTDDTAIELGEVETDSPETVADAIADHPAIVAYEALEIAEDRVIGKYETTDTGMYEFVAATERPPEYPIVVRNGWFEFDLTGTRAEFDGFRAGLDAQGEAYELLSVVEADEPERLLTDRQREVMEAALREGYYTIPRECTLTDLAATLEVDKSTASDVLRRAEARLVTWFLTGPDDR